MHSIAFQIGGLTIYWYGIFVALGFLAGLWTASRRARTAGLSAEKIFDLGPWLILGGIIGGRLLFVVSYWREEFAGKPFIEIFMLRKGGLVFYGGLIGATLAAMLYIRLKKLPLWKLADVLAPSIAIGYFFGRFGCLMNGCCYGQACDLPWAVTFPLPHGSGGVPVHPTQVYDSLLNLVFYLFLAWLFRRKKFDGQVFAVYLVGYGILRSFVEFFRGDYATYIGGWITPAHLVSVGIVTAGLVLYLLLRRPREKQV